MIFEVSAFKDVCGFIVSMNTHAAKDTFVLGYVDLMLSTSAVLTAWWFN